MSTETEAPEGEGSKTSLIVFSVIALIVAGLAFNSWRVRSGWLRDLKGDNLAARKTAAEAMMRRGQVAEQLQGQPPSVRMAAVQALAEIRSPLPLAQQAATELMQFRKDPDEPIKDLAKVELIRMGPEIVLKPALDALENSDDAIGSGVQDVLKDGQFARTDKPETGDMPLVARKLVHPDARNNAAGILTDLKTPAIPYVIPNLHPKPEELIGTSTVEDVQLTAIGILDGMHDPKAVEAIPNLIEMLNYQHTQLKAVGALGRMPRDEKRVKAAIPGLLRVLKENELIRGETVVALGNLADPRAVPALVQLLGSYSEELRGQSAEGLHKILVVNPTAIGPVLAAAKSPSATVRAGAIDAIGSIPGPAAQGATLAALKDPDAEVRLKAARGLGARTEPGNIAPLIAAFNDADGRVGAEAAGSLAAIGKPAVPALVSALKTPAGAAQPQSYYAQQALRDIHQDAVPALEKAVRTGDDATARFAALLLRDIGGAESIAALEDAARRPSPDVRWAAERSLRALRGTTADSSTASPS